MISQTPILEVVRPGIRLPVHTVKLIQDNTLTVNVFEI